MIHTLEFDLVTVQQIEVAFHINRLEPKALMDAAVRTFNVKVIQDRILCAPLQDLKLGECDLGLTFLGCGLHCLSERLPVMVGSLNCEAHLLTVCNECCDIGAIGLSELACLNINVPYIIFIRDS